MTRSMQDIHADILRDVYAMKRDQDRAEADGDLALIAEIDGHIERHLGLITMSQHQRDVDLKQFVISGLCGAGLGFLVIATAQGWI